MTDRFDRQERFFGREGQARISASRATIVGAGGLGTQLIQQHALLGVGHLSIIDKEDLAKTDRNRYVGARNSDLIPGTPKVDIGERLIKEIDPAIEVHKVYGPLLSEEAFTAIIEADVVFGCLDTEGSRLVLTELCAAYDRPYIDLASDIVPGDLLRYGGRVCVSWHGSGCLVCRNLLDVPEAQADLAGEGQRKTREQIYGVPKSELDQIGPSVVSINGLVVSLAMTEFIVGVTGIRVPRPLLTYRGHLGIVTVSSDVPAPNCYYCCGIRGKRDSAGVERYLRSDFGAILR